MKTESHSIYDVLAKNATSFFIPPFQRAYAWGKPEIERYFSDVTRIIDSELDKKQKDKLEHFFGTLVIKEEKAGFANKSVIVDGQQRLTSLYYALYAPDIPLKHTKYPYAFFVNIKKILEDDFSDCIEPASKQSDYWRKRLTDKNLQFKDRFFPLSNINNM